MISFVELFDTHDESDAITIMMDALESLAHRLVQHEHPTWYSIPDEEVVDVLRGEGVLCEVEESYEM